MLTYLKPLFLFALLFGTTLDVQDNESQESAEQATTTTAFKYTGITDPVLGKIKSLIDNKDENQIDDYKYSFVVIFIITLIVILLALVLIYLLLFLHSFCWERQRRKYEKFGYTIDESKARSSW